MNHIKFSYSLILLVLLFVVGLTTISCEVGIGTESQRMESRKGNNEYNQQNYQQSTVHYKKSLDIEQNVEALYGMGNTYSKNLNIKQLITKNDSSLLAQDSLINKYYGNASKTNIQNPKKRAMIFHNWGHHYYCMGLAFSQSGKEFEQNAQACFQQSVDKYKESLRLNPSDDKTRYNLAMAQYMLKEQERQQQENKNNQENQNQDDKDRNDKNQQDKDKQNQDDQNKNGNKDNKQNQNGNKDKEKDNNQEKNKDNNQDKNTEKDTPNNDGHTPNQPNNDDNKDNDTPTNPPSIDNRSFNVDRLLDAAQEEENRIKKRRANASRRNIKNW